MVCMVMLSFRRDVGRRRRVRTTIGKRAESCMVRRMPVTEATAKWVEEQFSKSIVPTLVDYIKIPNKSPGFDPEWRKNGHMARAVELLTGWAKQHLPEGAK